MFDMFGHWTNRCMHCRQRQTSEYGVHGEEVGADGECDHGECEGEELVDDGSMLIV
jgi:hypothetical protein